MILADIGNRHVHIWNEEEISHLSFAEVKKLYGDRKVEYISVNSSIEKELKKIDNWSNIADRVELCGSYEGMGIDRRVLCLSRGDGLYIDAGSAITIDRVKEGCYVGGAILPGIYAVKSAMAAISPKLNVVIGRISPDTLPKGTADGISYGIYAPVTALVEKLRRVDEKVYICGGDGADIAALIPNAIYNEGLVFEGMLKVLNKGDEL